MNRLIHTIKFKLTFTFEHFNYCFCQTFQKEKDEGERLSWNKSQQSNFYSYI